MDTAQLPEQKPVITNPSSRSHLFPLFIVGVAMLLLGFGGGYILFANKTVTSNTLPKPVTQTPSPTQATPNSKQQNTNSKIKEDLVSQYVLDMTDPIPAFPGKRLVLTSKSIDTIGYGVSPQPIIMLDESIGDPTRRRSKLLVDPSSLIALVIHSTWGDSENTTKTNMWIYNLKTKALIKKYPQDARAFDKFPVLSEFNYPDNNAVELEKKDDNLLLKDSNDKILYTINLTNFIVESTIANK